MKRTVFFKALSGYVLVILLIFLAVAFITPRAMKRVYVDGQIEHLEHAGAVIIPQVGSMLAAGDTAGLRSFISLIGLETGIRFTVIDADGGVVADSSREPADMENHLYRPEIFGALKGMKRTSIRRSSTLRAEMMYMSLPIFKDGKVIGVLRQSNFMKEVDVFFGKLRGRLLRIMLLAMVLGVLAAAFLSASLARPLSRIIEASAKVAGGDLGTKLPIRRPEEFRRIASGFNLMTEKLKAQFLEISDRNTELAGVLSSMREGLCLIDRSGRILLANPALKRITGVDAPEGRQYLEVILSSEFAGLVKRALATGRSTLDEIVIDGRIYLAGISLLPGKEKAVAGLYDLTVSREAERMKKDFVVNVSHELKTPLAAVKGFVETMEDSVDDKNRPYLEVVKRNIDRMGAIVDDLLFLSELEGREPQIKKEKIDAARLSSLVLETFKKNGAEKGLEVRMERPEDLPGLTVDAYQFERLLVNLLDNAVKYTEKGRVVLRLGQREGRFLVEVEDTGLGIGPEHLPRIFERFYVVDRSRSRKMGGTGLGLSIVKHIVTVHNGSVDIKSVPGSGTTVTVLLPLFG